MIDVELSQMILIGFGTYELLIVAGIFMLLFGSAKLPSLMRNMGRSVNEFKHGIKEKPVDTSIEHQDSTTKEDKPTSVG